jgi:hypothetical protein
MPEPTDEELGIEGDFWIEGVCFRCDGGTGTTTDDGLTYICRGLNGRALWNGYDAAWAEHDSTTAEGATNTFGGNVLHSVITAQWIVGQQVGNALGSGSCEGRCGAGCNSGSPCALIPTSYNWYGTKDCLDHDICLDAHPNAPYTSSSGDCGNEYSDAYWDFINGSSSSAASFCTGSSSCSNQWQKNTDRGDAPAPSYR